LLLSGAVLEEKAMPILVNLKTPAVQESSTQGPPCRWYCTRPAAWSWSYDYWMPKCSTYATAPL